MVRPTTKQYYELTAIRTESEKLFDFVSNGHSDYFQIDQSKLFHTASFVAEVIKENYPDLNIPLHSRIRHFSLSNTDLYEAYFDDGTKGNIEQLREQVELIITSVFLDGGAGSDCAGHTHPSAKDRPLRQTPKKLGPIPTSYSIGHPLGSCFFF